MPQCTNCHKERKYLPFRHNGGEICFSCKARIDIAKRNGEVFARNDETHGGSEVVKTVNKEKISEIFAGL